MKKSVSALVILMVVVSMFGCGEAKKDGVEGKTYVYESYVMNGESLDMDDIIGGEQFSFDNDKEGTYSMAPDGDEVTSFPFTYTVDGNNITVTVDYGADMINEIEFVLDGDKIINTTSGPAYDAEGNEIEGQTNTDVVTYTEKK